MCDYDKNTALVSLGESLERKKDLFSVFTFVFVFVYKQTKPIGGSLEEKSRVDFLFCVFCIYKQTTYLLCYSHKDCQFLIVRRQNILLAVVVVVVPLLLYLLCYYESRQNLWTKCTVDVCETPPKLFSARSTNHYDYYFLFYSIMIIFSYSVGFFWILSNALSNLHVILFLFSPCFAEHHFSVLYIDAQGAIKTT